MKSCSRCLTGKPLAEFYPDSSKRDGYHTVCKECVKADRKRRYAEDPAKYNDRSREYYQSDKGAAYRKRRYKRLRDAAFDVYGDSCVCCGTTGEQFLTIDHVGGWGAEHREEERSAGSIFFWLAKAGYPTEGFRVLCWNCNCALGVHGYCHEGTSR